MGGTAEFGWGPEDPVDEGQLELLGVVFTESSGGSPLVLLCRHFLLLSVTRRPDRRSYWGTLSFFFFSSFLFYFCFQFVCLTCLTFAKRSLM